MMQKNIGGTGRIDAQAGADNARSGKMRLDQVVFKVFIEKVADGHGPEAESLGQFLGAQTVGAFDQIKQLLQVADLERGWIGSRTKQKGPDETALPDDGLAEPVIGIDIAWFMAGDFPAQCVMIGMIGEIVAVTRKTGTALVRDHLKSETREFEVAHDFAAQQRTDIRAIGIGPAFVERAAYGSTADPVVFFDDKDFHPGLG